VLPPEALRNRLQQQSLGLLSGGPRDQPERHQTLRNAIAWSHDLLPADEQRLFRQLGVFAGGCTLEAGAAVAGDGQTEEEIVEPIAALVSKSLLVTSMQPDGHPRYRLLETIRQFALEQLTTADELRPALERHAQFFLSLAERAEAGSTGRDQAACLDRLAWEHENLLAALRWAARHHDPELELRLCGALAWFWLARGDDLQARELVEAALLRARPSTIDPALDGPPTVASATRAEAGAPPPSTHALASALLARALLAARTGDWRVSRETYEQRLTLGVRDTAGLLGLALARLRLGDRGAARALAADALALASELGDRPGQARALRLQAEIATERGDFAQASALVAESLAGWSDLRDSLLLASCLDTCAALAAARTHAARALRLAGAAARLRESVGAPLRGAERVALDRWLSLARQNLAPDAAEQAEAEGRQLTPEQAIQEATARPEPTLSGPDTSELRPLSDREAEVALLVARGWTNAQIGNELHLSERTVEAHLRRITHKLGFASRTQLAAWTVQRTSGQLPSSG
jgi:non-specific serine/threonine protein kinase